MWLIHAECKVGLLTLTFGRKAVRTKNRSERFWVLTSTVKPFSGWTVKPLNSFWIENVFNWRQTVWENAGSICRAYEYVAILFT